MESVSEGHGNKESRYSSSRHEQWWAQWRIEKEATVAVLERCFEKQDTLLQEILAAHGGHDGPHTAHDRPHTADLRSSSSLTVPRPRTSSGQTLLVQSRGSAPSSVASSVTTSPRNSFVSRPSGFDEENRGGIEYETTAATLDSEHRSQIMPLSISPRIFGTRADDQEHQGLASSDFSSWSTKPVNRYPGDEDEDLDSDDVEHHEMNIGSGPARHAMVQRDSVEAPPLAERLATIVGKWDAWWRSLVEPPRKGCVYRILKSSSFNGIVAICIAANSAFTAYAADYDMSNLGQSATPAMQIIATFFLAIYMIECALKLWVHRLYYFCNGEAGWNVFDFVLVVTAIIDTMSQFASESSSNISFVRSLRILKVGRVLKILRALRFLRDLHMMVLSIIGSITSLFWSVVMLLLVLFMFGIYFTQSMTGYLLSHPEVTGVGDDDPSIVFHKIAFYWGSVARSALTLYQATTGGFDWENIYNTLVITGPVDCIVFVFYVTFFNFAVMNILTGIFVDNAMKFAAPDREQMVSEQRRKDIEDSTALRQLIFSLTPAGEGWLTKEEFSACLANQHFASHLRALGLDVYDAELFLRSLTEMSGNDEIWVDDFIDHCVRLKGVASSIDLQNVAFLTKTIHREVQHFNVEQAEMLKTLALIVGGEVAKEMIMDTPARRRQSLIAGHRRMTNSATGSVGLVRPSSHDSLASDKGRLRVRIDSARGEFVHRGAPFHVKCEVKGKPQLTISTSMTLALDDAHVIWDFDGEFLKFCSDDTVVLSLYELGAQVNILIGTCNVDNSTFGQECELPIQGVDGRIIGILRVMIMLTRGSGESRQAASRFMNMPAHLVRKRHTQMLKELRRSSVSDHGSASGKASSQRPSLLGLDLTPPSTQVLQHTSSKSSHRQSAAPPASSSRVAATDSAPPPVDSPVFSRGTSSTAARSTNASKDKCKDETADDADASGGPTRPPVAKTTKDDKDDDSTTAKTVSQPKTQVPGKRKRVRRVIVRGQSAVSIVEVGQPSDTISESSF